MAKKIRLQSLFIKSVWAAHDVAGICDTLDARTERQPTENKLDFWAEVGVAPGRRGERYREERLSPHWRGDEDQWTSRLMVVMVILEAKGIKKTARRQFAMNTLYSITAIGSGLFLFDGRIWPLVVAVVSYIWGHLIARAEDYG